MGIIPLEILNNARQPVNANAGEGPDVYGSQLDSMNGSHLLLQMFVPFQYFPYRLQNLLAIGCQLGARPVPDQQREAEFIFQAVDHMADTGLRKSHHFGSFGQASELDDL